MAEFTIFNVPRILVRNKAWLVLTLALLIFLSRQNVLVQVRGFILKSFVSPVNFIGGTRNFFSTKRTLFEENRFLRQKNAGLSLELGQFRTLAQENERLRGLLDFKKHFNFVTIPAEIIGRNPSGWIESIIINKGLEDGVYKDTIVCASGGLVGKVIEAEKNTSIVILVSHPSFRAGGMLASTRTSGIVVGHASGMARLLYLPMDLEIPKGELVITSEFSRIFPKDITIGIVVSVEKNKTGLYKSAVIKPAVNFYRQEEVLCIKRNE